MAHYRNPELLECMRIALCEIRKNHPKKFSQEFLKDDARVNVGNCESRKKLIDHRISKIEKLVVEHYGVKMSAFFLLVEKIMEERKQNKTNLN